MATKNVYKAVPGSHISDKDAQVIGRAVEKLEKRHGGATAELLVEEAKNNESPLHKFFQWNLKKAAESHWIDQARYLLRSVRVIIVNENTGEETQVRRAFVKIETDEKSSYRSTGSVMSNEQYRNQLLERALKELWDWQQRYRDLTELAAVFSAASQVEKILKQQNKRRRGGVILAAV